MTTVTVKGVGDIEFPDSMTAAEIQDVLRKKFGGKTKPKPTAADRVATFGSGANQAIADYNPLSFAVDKTADVLNLIPGVDIQNPVGGSNWLREHVMPAPHPPQDETGQYFNAAGRGVGNVAANALTLGAAGAASPAAQGLLKYVPQSVNALTAELGLGAASGAGAKAGSEFGGPVGALAGGVLAPALLGAAGLRAGSPETLYRNALSAQHDVPLTLGERMNNVPIQRAETLLENIPGVGMVPFRKQQGQALRDASQRMVGKFSTGVEDPQAAVQRSLNAAYGDAKRAADARYTRFRDIASKIGKPVPTSNLQSAAASIIKNEAELPGALQNRSGGRIAADLAETGSMDIGKLTKTRQRINSALRDARKANISGSVSNEQVAALQSLKKAIDDDLSVFAENRGGPVLNAYKKANQFYRENVAPFEDPALKRAGSDAFDTDTLLKMFVKNDRPKLAAKLYNNLTPEGKANVKYGILQNAFNKAVERGERGGIEFSPATFATELKRLGDTKSAIFSPHEQRYINGLAKLARVAVRGGQYAENPPTGNRLVQGGSLATLGYLGMEHPTWLLAAFGTARAAKTLFTKPWAQRLLVKASKSDSPPELQKINEQFSRRLGYTAPKAAALGVLSAPTTAAAQSNGQGER